MHAVLRPCGQSSPSRGNSSPRDDESESCRACLCFIVTPLMRSNKHRGSFNLFRCGTHMRMHAACLALRAALRVVRAHSSKMWCRKAYVTSWNSFAKAKHAKPRWPRLEHRATVHGASATQRVVAPLPGQMVPQEVVVLDTIADGVARDDVLEFTGP